MPPSVRYGWIGFNFHYVRERDFERTLECPQLVDSLHVQHEIAIGNGYVNHAGAPVPL